MSEITNVDAVAEENFEELLGQSIKTLNTGDKVLGVVTAIGNTEVQVDLGTKHAGYIPYDEVSADPSVKPEDILKVGDEIDATIVSITPFGAFAQIIDGVDGLIHISQLADKRVENVKDIVSVGDVVRVKIIDIDIENKRISISMRALLEENNDADYED